MFLIAGAVLQILFAIIGAVWGLVFGANDREAIVSKSSKSKAQKLIEKNSGLAHCFVALGEIVVLCLLGTFFAYPVHFYGTFML